MSNPTQELAASTAVDEELTGLNELVTMTGDERDVTLSFDEAIAASGLSEEEMVVIVNPYTVLQGKDKDTLMNVPFFVRMVRFAIDPETERPYAVFYAVKRDDTMVIFTDGSTGVFAQMRRIVGARLNSAHATPLEGFLFVNGLRSSEYGVDKAGKPVKPGEKFDSKATTYYFA